MKMFCDGTKTFLHQHTQIFKEGIFMKNTIKKALSLVLACMLVFSLTAISALAEGETVLVTMGYAEGQAGQQVVVPVTLGADSNVASGSFAIDFDSTQLTFVEATEGTLALSYCQVGVTVDNADQIGVAFIAEDFAAVDAAGGTLFNLVFTVNEAATAPVVELGFNFEPVRASDDPGLFDADNNKLAYTAVDGAVVTGVTADVQVSLGAVDGIIGGTVAVPVNVTANSNIVSGAFTVAYDAEALTFAGYEAGDIEEVTQLEVALVADGANEVGVLFSTQNAATAITAAGTVAYIKFSVVLDKATNLSINLTHPTDASANGGVASAEGDITDAVFVGGRVNVVDELPEEPPVEPTTADVTFNVSPADATVVLDGATKVAVDGVATFEGVEFGEKAYTVSAEGYVTVEGTVTVAADMAAVSVTLEPETVEPTDYPVPTLEGIRAAGGVSYDPVTHTISAIVYDYEASGGVTITIPGAVTKDIKLTNNTTSIYRGANSGVEGSVKISASKANGLDQTASITYGDYVYPLSIKFIPEPKVEFLDFVALRSERDKYVYDSKTKTITMYYDRFNILQKSGTSGFAFIVEDGIDVVYEFDADKSSGNQTDFAGTTDTKKYTSMKTGKDGEYDTVKLRFFRNFDTSVESLPTYPDSFANVTLTNKATGESTTYVVNHKVRDVSVEGDVDITAIHGLRAIEDSFVLDNENKTITFSAKKENKTAGFAVEVGNGLTIKTRPRKVLSPESGYGLSIGNVNQTANPTLANACDRYVNARQSWAENNTQTYKVKVFGGERGLTYSIFTVTINWVD